MGNYGTDREGRTVHTWMNSRDGGGEYRQVKKDRTEQRNKDSGGRKERHSMDK